MTRAAFVLTGLVRNLEEARAHIDEYTAIEACHRPTLVFSTWAGELDRYPDFRTRLRALDAHIIEQPQPEIILPGHMLHQIASLEAALGILDDDCLVLKARPDLHFAGVLTEFVATAAMPRPLSATGPGSPFRHKVQIVQTQLSSPFYINDIAFCGYVEDLRVITRLDFLAGLRLIRIGPEQLLWSSPFRALRRPLETYFRIHAGMLFSNPDLLAALRHPLQESPLYQQVIADWITDFRASFQFSASNTPDRERGMAAAHTLEEMMWNRCPVGLGHFYSMAGLNAYNTMGVFDAVTEGEIKSSAFGDAVMQRISAPATLDAGSLITYSRSLGEAISALLDTDITNPYRQDGLDYAIGTPARLWTFGHLGTDATTHLEAEINRLRRQVDGMSKPEV